MVRGNEGMRIRPILGGLKSYIPWLSSSRGTGGTISARYCYSVWLRHLCLARDYGLPTQPAVIAELGPGDSIGSGLAGLLSGSQKYYALDVVQYTTTERNRAIFEELVALFASRADIPDEDEFPDVYPRLSFYGFPSGILTEERLGVSLDAAKLDGIRQDLLDMPDGPQGDSTIRYICPWYDSAVIEPETVDMIFSQAVLEHVEEIEATCQSMHRWLKTGGVMSHQIDFSSHNITETWNGHWSLSDFTWRLIKGRKRFLINREPLSTHVELLKKTGFRVVCVLPVTDTGGTQRSGLARRYEHISDEDLTTKSAHILAVKE